MAIKLASDGMRVIVHGRDAARGDATVRAIEEAGGQARFVAADLSDADEVTRLAAEVGDVDVLVNNGGISWFGPTVELDTHTFDTLFASNVRSAYQLVAALAPGMASRGHGSIVSLDSMAGHIGLVGGAAYGATKAALTAMSRAWAAEFSPAGVRVNTVAPDPSIPGPTRIGSRNSAAPRWSTALLRSTRSQRSLPSLPRTKRAT